MIGLAAALAACGRADADGATAPVKPPAGWQALSGLATAAGKAAAAEGITVDGAEAWGDPPAGCYAVWVGLHGSSGDAPALAKQVVDGFAAAKLETSDVTSPATDDGVLALRFTAQGGVKGRLKARLGGGKISALACFANPREPKACEATCTTMLGAIE